MSTVIERAPRSGRRFVLSRRHRRVLRKAGLACGIGYGATYIIANDLIAASMWDNYNAIDQAISELSGTDAPSKAFLTGMLPVFSLLVLGFGMGVWKAAGEERALRVTGGILMAQSLMFPLWLLFPMSSRAELAGGGGGANDIGHGVMGALALLFIITEMGFSAAAFGKRFRYFSIAMAILTFSGGAYMAMSSSALQAGDPTPWMGFIERIMYGAWLLWMAVLSVALLRKEGTDKVVPPALHQTSSVESSRMH